jgi:outer membrane protein assembly factor BamB
VKCSRLRCCLVVLLLTAICSCTKPAGHDGFDWPQWRGPDGNGQSRETEWNPASIASLKVLWKTDIGRGYANVVIQSGRLYTAGLISNGGFTVFCLDAATGRRIWQRSFESRNYPQATPAVDGDSLFVLTVEGLLYGINSRTGRQRWRKDLVADYGAVKPYYDFAGSPVVSGDLVVLTANTAGIAVKRDSGELAWTSEKPPKGFVSVDPNADTGTAYSTPVLYEDGGRRLAIVASWRGITSVDVQTGEPVRQLVWETGPDGMMGPDGMIADPVLAGDRICVAQAFTSAKVPSGFLKRMDDTGSGLLWRTANLYCNGAPPVIIDGSIYSMHMGPSGGTLPEPTTLRCLDLETGRLNWDEPLGPNRGSKSFPLTAANGVLIVLDDEGTLYTAQASPEGFKEIARCDVLQSAVTPRVFWTPPVLCNAKIYCRNFTGDLVCIDVSK